MTSPNQSEIIRAAVNEACKAMRAESDSIMGAIRAKYIETLDELNTEVKALRSANSNAQERLNAVNAALSDAIAHLNKHNARSHAAIEAAMKEANAAITNHSKTCTDVVSRRIEAVSKSQQEALLNAATKAQQEATRATQAIAKSVAAEKEAQVRLEAADKQEAKAQKAVQIMTLAGDHEVKRAAAEMEYKARRKAMLTSLEREQEELENRFELESDQIQKGINTYYPELVQKLKQLTKDATDN